MWYNTLIELSIKKSYIHLTEAEKKIDKIPYLFWDKNIQQAEYTQHYLQTM